MREIISGYLAEKLRNTRLKNRARPISGQTSELPAHHNFQFTFFYFFSHIAVAINEIAFLPEFFKSILSKTVEFTLKRDYGLNLFVPLHQLLIRNFRDLHFKHFSYLL